nr:hypothetical protein [Tolivirales sp.]
MNDDSKQSGSVPPRGLGAAKNAHRAGGHHRAKPPHGGGPAHAHTNRAQRAGNARQQINAAVANYHMTEAYKRGRDVLYPGAAELGRFNTWVRNHLAEINPAEQKVCVKCGHVDFILCDCSIKTQPPVPPPQPVVPAPIYYQRIQHPWYVRWFYNVPPNPSFDMGQQNGKNLAWFKNSSISDDQIIPSLFNYITVNQQTSYAVSGQDVRSLRLAHSHRLALRWAEKENVADQLDNDTMYSHRFRFTIQRACDQAVNSMLYEYTDPTRESHFGLAWLPTCAIILCVMILSFVALVMVGEWYQSTVLAGDSAAEDYSFAQSWAKGGSNTV